MRDPFFEDPACRVCGCTEHNACVDPRVGPCWWVDDDLCSHCERRMRIYRTGLYIAAGMLAAAAAIWVWMVRHGA